MKSILVSILALLAFTASHAQSLPTSIYSAFSIPDSMKKNANVVFRLDEQILQVRSRSRYLLKEHLIATMLNENGSYMLKYQETIDKFRSVNDIEVKVYDAIGKEVKRYKKKDFSIHAAYDGVSLVTDDKVMYLEMPPPGYPCTVEITCAKEVTGYLSLPGFYVNNRNNSVETYRSIVEIPSNMDFRHRTLNLNSTPEVINSGDKKTYLWQGSNLVAQRVPGNGFNGLKYASFIQVSTSDFELDGYQGSFKNWKTFGAWNYQFYKEDAPFTPERIVEIKQLVAFCKTDVEKIRILYDHMKKNMRYVSIQLGIGGMRPFTASFVDQKKYGDCKALSNYMCQMLKVIGINSYPALINSGYDSPPVDESFPIYQFDHVILCVPQPKDSIWLECTSNFSASGFLGSFTENKKALLITPDGGVLVSTPKSNSSNSRLVSKTEIKIDEDGSGTANRTIFCSGDELEVFEYLRQLNADDKKRILVKNLTYRAPDDYLLAFKGDTSNGYRFDFQGAYSQLFDFKAGSKMFFPQTVSRISDEELKMDTARKIEYLFDHPYERIDTTIYLLPKTMGVETLLPGKTLTTDIASYRFETSYDESSNKLQVVSHLVLKENQVPPGQYQALATFFSAVNRNQEQKLVVKFKE